MRSLRYRVAQMVMNSKIAFFSFYFCAKYHHCYREKMENRLLVIFVYGCEFLSFCHFNENLSVTRNCAKYSIKTMCTCITHFDGI